ncbi:MAG: SagB/ThcOx family dehydrogenase [Caldisericia bacterium]
MNTEQLSKILYLTQGITGEVGVAKLRSVASAGNRHPFNNYIMVNNVSGLEKGLYFYDHLNEKLVPLKLADLTKEFQDACLGQKMIANCQISFIQTAVTARTTSRYHERGYRYIFLDAGHIGAQVQLICENIGLGSCAMWVHSSTIKYQNF